MSEPSRKLAVLLSLSGDGGVEKMVLNLLPEFVRQGAQVDLLAIFRKPPTAPLSLPEGARLIDLGVRGASRCVPALTRYLRAERPQALLAAKDRAIRAAVLARALSDAQTRLVGRLGTNLSAALERKHPLQRWLRQAPMAWFYQRVDAIVAVSQGVADDTRIITGLAAEKIAVVRNPVIGPRLSAQSLAPVDHPWLADKDTPLILGAGRLTAQKDFPTLLRAFARLRALHPARLIILGEGRQRGELLRLAEELGVADDFDLPGYVSNPAAWMARASLFALSSAWEGSPNVLTEALALGTPAVATDCPSGPREILADGRHGPLVAVGDVEGLAQAMAQTLAAPLPPAQLREAVAEYHAELSARRYLEILGFPAH